MTRLLGEVVAVEVEVQVNKKGIPDGRPF